MPDSARGRLHQGPGSAAELALLPEHGWGMGRPGVMRRLAVLGAAAWTLGTLIAASPRALADGFKFDPLPTVTKDNEEVPDLDKMFGAKQLHFTAIKQPSKRNALLAWGGIASGDSKRFELAMKAAKPIEEVWLYSGGGSLSEGLQMGRMIHKAHL